ncbi:MAG: Flp1 family type IVb pilin [Syntrophomonas sp.]
MLEKARMFWKDEEGMGTLEVIVIIAALIAVGLLFKDQIYQWVEGLLGKGSKSTENIFNN